MTNIAFAKTNIINSKSLDDVKNYVINGLDNTLFSYTTDFFGTTELMNAHLWQHEDFNYEFNDYGFREDSLPSETDIGAFGCSFTFGTGLPQARLWHKLLANHHGCSSLNFGAPGRSIESIIDIFLIVSQHIKMKSAIFLLPVFTRKQLAMPHPVDKEVINYVNTDVNYHSKVNSEYGINTDAVYRALSDEELFRIVRDKIYLLDHIAALRNINVYISSWDEQTYQFLNMLYLDNITVIPRWKSPSMQFANTDLARDNQHPGIKHHELWAELIKDYISID